MGQIHFIGFEPKHCYSIDQYVLLEHPSPRGRNHKLVYHLWELLIDCQTERKRSVNRLILPHPWGNLIFPHQPGVPLPTGTLTNAIYSALDEQSRPKEAEQGLPTKIASNP